MVSQQANDLKKCFMFLFIKEKVQVVQKEDTHSSHIFTYSCTLYHTSEQVTACIPGKGACTKVTFLKNQQTH